MKLIIGAAICFVLLMLGVGIVVCVLQNGALLKQGVRSFVVDQTIAAIGIFIAIGIAGIGYWLGGFILKIG